MGRKKNPQKGQSTFACFKCYQEFDNLDRLYKHKDKGCKNKRHQGRPPSGTLCRRCNIYFETSTELQYHTAQGHPREFLTSGRQNQGVLCRYCSSHFRDQRDLEDHIAAGDPCGGPEPKTQPQGNHFCQYCRSSFTKKKELRAHIAAGGPCVYFSSGTQTQGPNLCRYCSTSFKSDKELGAHIAAGNPCEFFAPEVSALCKYCDAFFETQRGLADHIGAGDPCGSFEPGTQTEDDNFCKHCSSSFESPEELEDHIAAGDPCKFCEFGEQVQDQPTTTYFCHQCNYYFESAERIDGHIDYGHPYEPTLEPTAQGQPGDYFCKHCEDTFGSMWQLGGHITWVHQYSSAKGQGELPEGKFCELCDYCFGTTEQLRDHVDSGHPYEPSSTPRIYVCEDCDYAFGHKEALSNHHAICTYKVSSSIYPTDARVYTSNTLSDDESDEEAAEGTITPQQNTHDSTYRGPYHGATDNPLPAFPKLMTSDKRPSGPAINPLDPFSYPPSDKSNPYGFFSDEYAPKPKPIPETQKIEDLGSQVPSGSAKNNYNKQPLYSGESGTGDRLKAPLKSQAYVSLFQGKKKKEKKNAGMSIGSFFDLGAEGE